jgi:signal transduction histidine kinase
MKNLKIKAKLILCFALVSALTLLIGIVGIVNLNSLNDSYTSAGNIHTKPLVTIGYALVELQQTRFELRGAFIYADDPARLHAIEDSVQKSFNRFETFMDEYQKTIVRDDAREIYNEGMSIYRNTYKPNVQKVLENAKKDGVDRNELMEVLLITKPAADEMVSKFMDIMNTKASMMLKTSADCTAQAHTASVSFLAIIVTAFLLSIVLGLHIAAHISRPLSILTLFMKKASTTGDLICTPDERENITRFAKQRDEIGQTLASCAKFIKRITDAGDILQTVANGNLTAELPLLSEKDTVGLSIKKLTNGLNFMMSKIEGLLSESQAANRAKSEFMSRMSHEMLTPMNAIIGLMQITKQFGTPNQVKEYLDIMDNASHQLLQLITNVLEMSSMESDMLKLDHAAFSFHAMFDEALQTVSPVIKEKNQTFTQHIDPAIPQQLMGDKDRFIKVISCLLGNAVKFTPEHGTIQFAANLVSKENGNIVLQIEVADSGIGISKEQQRILFDLFEQVDGGHSRKYGGIGLGLALAKRIIEVMGGKIWVDSELGKGAKFTFVCTVKGTE